MARAWKLRSASAAGSARIAPSGPPSAVGAPRNGRVWISITMMPMPDMNPGHHHVRRVGHEAAESQHAEQHLHAARPASPP